MKSFKHTPETDDLIRRNYGSRPVAAIAAELGVTRNVVIGRARRLGLADAARGTGQARRDWWYAHPEYLEMRSEISRAWWAANPEAREAQSMRMQGRWAANPDAREAMSKRMQRMWAAAKAHQQA